MRVRAQQRVQGRFVSTCGLRKIVCALGSRYELLVIDGSGHPVSHLTEWYQQRKQPGADSTRRTYLNFLLPFMGYLLQREAAWNQPPEMIRTLVKEFLRDEVACQVARDQDLDGYRVRLTGKSPLSQSSLRVLFAALRDFYAVMADAGLYAYDNPMRSELLSKWKREHLKHVANAGAPDHAGIRSETWARTNTIPTAFFRQKRGEPWKPQLALEPALVLQRVRSAIDTMIAHAPTQRDRVILLLLNHTGARLSEILGMTAGGYRKIQHAYKAMVTNKGSLGREEKLIVFTSTIEHALVQYIRTERAKHDPQGRKRMDQLADHEPLFLTRRGTPYQRTSFYYHWRIWLAAVPPDDYADMLGPVAFSPHDIRHSYVTWILRQMKQKYEKQPAKLMSLQSALQLRMGWRSPLMIRCYDHSESEREKLEQYDVFLEELEQETEEHNRQPAALLPSDDDSVQVMAETYPPSLAPLASSSSSTTRGELVPPIHRDLSDLAFWKD
jgi:integrase